MWRNYRCKMYSVWGAVTNNPKDQIRGTAIRQTTGGQTRTHAELCHDVLGTNFRTSFQEVSFQEQHDANGRHSRTQLCASKAENQGGSAQSTPFFERIRIHERHPAVAASDRLFSLRARQIGVRFLRFTTFQLF